jgi:hypothetical protein
MIRQFRIERESQPAKLKLPHGTYDLFYAEREFTAANELTHGLVFPDPERIL